MSQRSFNINKTVNRSEQAMARIFPDQIIDNPMKRMGNLGMILNIKDRATNHIPKVISVHTEVYDLRQIILSQNSHGAFMMPISAQNQNSTGLLYFKTICEMEPTLPVALRYTAKIRNTRDFCFRALNSALGMPLFRIINNWEIVYEPVITARLNPVFLPFELICLNPDFDHLPAQLTFYVSDLKTPPGNVIISHLVIEVY